MEGAISLHALVGTPLLSALSGGARVEFFLCFLLVQQPAIQCCIHGMCAFLIRTLDCHQLACALA